MFRKFIGNKQFYKNLLLISIPIILSQLITQFVSLLDNLMVGQLTTAEFDGVSIANQFFFIFNLAIFGALAGPSVFATQYHGANDTEQVKECIRYKIVLCFIILLIGLGVFLVFNEQLFNLFIHEEDLIDVSPADVIKYGKDYLYIMLIGMLPFAICELYSSNLREAKQTFVPMIANITAVLINLVLNYILIFGKFGFPVLGVKGAAVATVIARCIACLIVVVYSYLSKKHSYNKIGFNKILPSKTNFITIFKKSYLLLLNEFLWSLGMLLVNFAYSFKGLEVVAATNISSTFVNLFGLLGIAIGNGIAIILGQMLGAKRLEEAREDSYRYLAFSVVLGISVAILMYILRNTVPSLYNMEDNVIKMAENLIAISALILPIRVYCMTCYFIIRSGGKVFITFMFDSVFTIAIRVPITLAVAVLTDLSIYYVYLISELVEVIKIVLGTILVKKGIWLVSITK